MGSIISKIRDDEDDYELLCRKYNEKIDKVYSVHNKWLNSREQGSTESYEEYEKNFKIKLLKLDIERRERQLKEKREELLKIEQ